MAEAVKRHTSVIKRSNRNIDVDPELLHLFEARRQLLKRWKKQKHSHKLNMLIAKLRRGVETCISKLESQTAISYATTHKELVEVRCRGKLLGLKFQRDKLRKQQAASTSPMKLLALCRHNTGEQLHETHRASRTDGLNLNIGGRDRLKSLANGYGTASPYNQSFTSTELELRTHHGTCIRAAISGDDR